MVPGTTAAPAQVLLLPLLLLIVVMPAMRLGGDGAVLAACTQGWANAAGACQYCWPQFYGTQCSMTCTCLWGTCDNGTAGTGQCVGNCSRSGMTGANCDQCASGRYGSVCQFTCPSCVHGTCDPATGRCACDRGWYGRLCNSTVFTRTRSRTLIPPPTTTAVPATTANVTLAPNASTTTVAPNSSRGLTTTSPASTAPVAACGSGLVYGLMIVMVSPVATATLRDAVGNASRVSATYIDVWFVTDAVGIGANFAYAIAFSGAPASSWAAQQGLFAQLITALNYDPRNAVARLGLVTFAPMCAPNVTASASSNTTTSVPLAPRLGGNSPDSAVPTYGIVLISLAIVLVLVAAAVAAWIVYSRRLVAEDKRLRAQSIASRRARDLEMTRLAGENAALDNAGATFDDDSAALRGSEGPRKSVTFGMPVDAARQQQQVQAALARPMAPQLPDAPLRPDDEFVVSGGGTTRPPPSAARNDTLGAQNQSEAALRRGAFPSAGPAVVRVPDVDREEDDDPELLDARDVDLGDAMGDDRPSLVSDGSPRDGGGSTSGRFSPVDGGTGGVTNMDAAPRGMAVYTPETGPSQRSLLAAKAGGLRGARIELSDDDDD